MEDKFPTDDPDDDATLEIPITGVLDLHAFRPNEIGALVRDYVDEAYSRGIYELRIIHGKGIGQQRETVRKILEKDDRVVEFGDAKDASSWGATCVTLKEG